MWRVAHQVDDIFCDTFVLVGDISLAPQIELLEEQLLAASGVGSPLGIYSRPDRYYFEKQ